VVTIVERQAAAKCPFRLMIGLDCVRTTKSTAVLVSMVDDCAHSGRPRTFVRPASLVRDESLCYVQYNTIQYNILLLQIRRAKTSAAITMTSTWHSTRSL